MLSDQGRGHGPQIQGLYSPVGGCGVLYPKAGGHLGVLPGRHTVIQLQLRELGDGKANVGFGHFFTEATLFRGPSHSWGELLGPQIWGVQKAQGREAGAEAARCPAVLRVSSPDLFCQVGEGKPESVSYPTSGNQVGRKPPSGHGAGSCPGI